MSSNIRSAHEEDALQVLGIYATHIIDSAVSFETRVPTEIEMRKRLVEHLSFAPWLVFESEGKVRGYAYASKHRAREAYQWTVEVSAYVDKTNRRRGIARELYAELFLQLKGRGFYLALAGITLPNEASVRFHESMGFSSIGIYRNIGYKLGAWHDVGWWQRPLNDFNEPRPLIR